MTGAEFYEEFKSALDYLGCGFRGMNQAKVCLWHGELRMDFDGRTCLIKIGEHTNTGAHDNDEHF